jgi:hypothetical protein
MLEEGLFAGDVGTWDAEVTLRMDPDGPEQYSSGVSVCHMVGNWLVADFKNETGFAGHGIYGWDFEKKALVATWIDTMRPWLRIMLGTWDAAAQALTFEGEGPGPDGKWMRWREITERPDDDTRIFHVRYGDFEAMTVTYRRRKS